MKRGWLRLPHYLILLWLIAAMLASAGALAQAGPSPGVVITPKMVSWETELLAGEVKIPVITGLSDAELENFLNFQWEREINSFVEGIRAEAEAFHRELGEEANHWLPFQAYVDFKIGYLDERFVSLPVVYYCYTGGAHGMSFQVSNNVDLAAGTRLNLEDLFLPGYDFCGVIAAEVNRQRAENPDYYFDETMAETVILPDHPFYLTSQGIVVYFGLYEIAPYSTGIPEFLIPYEYLWEGLKPEIQAIAKTK
ncbi:MAG: DUF3298 and DUF4163 domain-containing protein [Firmicutes bacterium]|nr:DUF3298 and DUF4163 domain-containing protein [Bacillota bacterium]